MLTKEGCQKVLDKRKEAYENVFKVSVIERNDEFYEDIDIIQQLIHEHFDNQFLDAEVELLISLLRRVEDELGMDITLLIDKLKRIQSTLPKEKGVVTCVEFKDD